MPERIPPSEVLDNDLAGAQDVFTPPASDVLDTDLAGGQEALEGVSDAQCVNAMRENDLDSVRTWYAAQERIADADPSPQGRLNLIMKQAKLQLDAGLTEDGLDTLEVARWDAANRHDTETARRLTAILEQLTER